MILTSFMLLLLVGNISAISQYQGECLQQNMIKLYSVKTVFLYRAYELG
jgi:hypothetical protein